MLLHSTRTCHLVAAKVDHYLELRFLLDLVVNLFNDWVARTLMSHHMVEMTIFSNLRPLKVMKANLFPQIWERANIALIVKRQVAMESLPDLNDK